MSKELAPGFLIAFPHLADPNFHQSVVLLLNDDEAGSMGLVVNQEAPMLLSDLCRDHEIAYSGEEEKRVRTGGPCQPEQGIVLYGSEHEDPEGRPVVEGLHVSASRGTLSRLCDLPTARFHCYSGYAGWGPGQLENEIREGSWVMAPASARMVLDDPPGDVWRRSLAALGIDPASLVPGGRHEA